MANLLPPIGTSGLIVILKILQCIPAVTIFAFLELEQLFSFVDGH